MSISDEKYRSIFKMRSTLVALCFSRFCKIPIEWREEIRSAIKHAPSTCDKIKIDGKTFSGYNDHVNIDEMVDFIGSAIIKKDRKSNGTVSKAHKKHVHGKTKKQP